MALAHKKPNYRRKLIIGVAIATILSAVIIGTVANGLLNVASSVERFGFSSFRQIQVTLLDATRLGGALKAAMLAPDNPESLEYLSEANDLAYIRFITGDRSKLIEAVPRYVEIVEGMETLIGVMDLVIDGGLPMDVPDLQRANHRLVVLLADMNKIYYSHGNQVNAEVELADKRLYALTNEIGFILILFFLLTVIAVILMVKRHEAAILMKEQATHDSLTGLKNRAWLSKNNERLFDIAHVSGQPLLLFLIDLDHFKEVNDTYGHHIGDALLVHVAGILAELEEEDKVVPVRLGGDELALFVIADDEDAATAIRAQVHQSLNTTVELAGHEMRLGSSIGVAIYPQHGSEIESLTHNADVALYKAKDAGRARIVLYDPEIMGNRDEKGNMQNRIREAIANNEFELYWQPIFDLHNASLSGAEAFLRWNDAEKDRVLMPKDFIPLAEQSDLIYDIDRMVLMKACTEAARWEAEMQTDFVISVNVSAQHLQAENFPDYLASVASRAGLSPSHLEIDITESIFVADRNLAFETVRRIRKLGFRVALDDFGKGTADLQYLAELDVDRLKIDGSFMRGIERSPKKQALVASIISAGRASNALIIAEGVETQAQMSFLMQHDCDFAQGYLLSKPTDSRTFRTYLQRNIGKTSNSITKEQNREKAA